MTHTPHLRQFALLCTSALGTLGWAAPAMAEMAADAADSPTIIVYGRPDGYDTEKTPTATKTSTPLVDVPQAMNVISREQLNDQGIDSLAEALRFVPGVVLGQG